jgi:hypothetical protein
MNERAIIAELQRDLQRAAASGNVVYLEGRSDVAIFFALLGVRQPQPDPSQGVLHRGVLVRGLRDKDRGSGSSAVQQRIEVAQRHGIPGIHGIVDGDGQPFATLASTFDPPFPGPLFTWKAYSIENLLVKTGWPAAWGDSPDWIQALNAHAPYVALNVLHRRLLGVLKTLRLANFVHPRLDKQLETVDEVVAALRQDKHLLANRNVEHEFLHEVRAFEQTVLASLDQAHALVNGKWLVDVFAPRQCKSTPDRCRDEWLGHAISSGGLPEVRDLWQRITGRPAA